MPGNPQHTNRITKIRILNFRKLKNNGNPAPKNDNSTGESNIPSSFLYTFLEQHGHISY